MSFQQNVLITTSSRLTDVLTQKEVDTFLHQQAESTPFDSWAWLASADAALSDEQKCFIVSRSSDGELLGWLPLRISEESFLGLKFPVLRFLTEPKSDRHSVSISNDYSHKLNEMVDAARKKIAKWSSILLDEVSSEQLRNKKLLGWFVAVKRHTPVLMFEFRPDENTPSKSLIGKRGRRARKKLEKMDHTFRVWQPGEAELDDLLSNIRSVEGASWKGDEGVGIFGSEERYKFFRSVASHAASEGSLMVGTVHVEGKLASYRFGFLWNKVFYDYNFAYLPEYSHLSLGRVLLDEMILYGSENGLRGIDGSRVGSTYDNLLRERSEQYVEHCRLMYFRWTLGGILLRAKFLVLKPIKRFLKNKLNSLR